MDDMTTFERQVAGEFVRRAGPVRPVDATAIFSAITATRSPTWRLGSMLSATRFVVAGAIVALFGGFLLAGVLTQPSDERVPAAVTDSPGPTELLPSVDLVTEEVEPGIYRVLSDGTDHDLVFDTNHPESEITKVIAGQDGSVWVQDADRLFRLGSGGHRSTASISIEGLQGQVPDISIALDGTVWAISQGGEVWSSDGSEWTRHPRTPYVRFTDIETASDGDVWATWVRRGRLGIDRLVDGEWHEEAFEPPLDGAGASMAVGPDGTVLLGVASSDVGSGGWAGIMERDEDGWAPAVTFDPAVWGVGPIAFGHDGTAWANSQGPWQEFESPRRLHRRTADGWETFGADGSVPWILSPQDYGSSFAVSGDGRLWIAFTDPAGAFASGRDGSTYLSTLEGTGCGGVISFDGVAWERHLAGACAAHVDAAPDGNVWVAVAESDDYAAWAAGFPHGALDPERPPTGVYVITTEATEATE